MLADPQGKQPIDHEVAHAEGKPHALALGVWLVACGAVALALLLLFALNMRRGLNHDEHQFVASGALMAQGLRPWVDFPYFHLPTLAWLYAALFKITDHLLLGARLLSIAAAAGFLALLLGVALRRLTRWGAWARMGIGGALALLVLSTPAYLHAAGRAWNHDLAILLTLAAFLVQASACMHKPVGSLWRTFIAGVLLGMAIGVRLSIAPLAVPFALAPLLWRMSWRRALILGGALALGVAAGMLPVWPGLVAAPEAFFFGNLRYAALNTQWYAAQGVDISLAAKLRDGARFLVQPGNLLVVLLAGWQFVRVRGLLHTARAPELRFWLLALPFVLLGALAPTPLQMQYVYILIPFCALGFLLALAHDAPARAMLIGLGIAAAIAFALAIPSYAQGLQVLLQPSAWYPNKVHARGKFAAQLMGDAGPDAWLYTLAPIFPLEGNIAIDPRSATGPFAWRVASLLSADERARLQLLGPDELDGALTSNPARAILTGIHSDNETAVDGAAAEWAQTHDYVPVPMPDEGTLWLTPLATWGPIRLGAQTFPMATLAPGAPVAATLYLQSSAPTAVNLNLLLRVVNQTGSELYRFDGWPFGSATSTWQPDALWQDGHTFTIPTDAASGVYRIEASFYDPATLETLGDVESIGWLFVGADTGADASDADTSALAAFAEGIDLLAFAPATPAATAGELLAFTATWRAELALDRDYTVFAHLTDATGTLVAQTDRQPLDGFYPTSQWRVQTPIRDRFTLQLPTDLAAGDYTLLFGMYDAQTQQRLPLANGGDAYAAAVITVEP